MNTRIFQVGLLCLCLGMARPAATAGEPPAKVPEVRVVKPVVQEVTDYEVFTGRTDASAEVELRARVTGYLVKTPFQDGAEVKQGDLLFEIDPRPYRARLDAAEANLGLASARLKLAQANSQRVAALHANKLASQEELDKAAGERLVAEAEEQASKASLLVARLDMDFTRVQAPMNGQIGRRLIDPGNLVVADKTNLAVIMARDPLYAYFDIDERTLLRLRLGAKDGKIKAEKMPVFIKASGEEGFPHKGVVDFTDNRVNPDTGSIRLRVVVSNKDKVLFPGLFVRVRVQIGEPYKALLLPAEAVMSDQGQKFVYVVNAKDVIERRPVVMGQDFDGRKVVAEGLKADDRVVIGRLQRLRPGDTIRPREIEAPVPKLKAPPEKRGQGPVPPGGLKAGSGILVEAVYPGASAQVVSDTVRAPIEEQVGGMEKLHYTRSRCGDDGKFGLVLAFRPGIDRNLTQVLVQNRVSLAMPVLPAEVQNAGVTVLKGTSGVLLIANLSSPAGRYNELYLSNYADIQLKDEVSRLPGVAKVNLIGEEDFRARLWLDTEKLAALSLTAADVLQALEKNKKTRAEEPHKLAELVVKTNASGQMVRLRDVASVELGAGQPLSQASQQGNPITALVVYMTGDVSARKVRAALQDKLAELRSRLAEGLDLKVDFDFTANYETPVPKSAPEYLAVDLDFPGAASPERIAQAEKRCAAVLRELPRVQHTLALSESPFDVFGNQPCVLVRLSPAEQKQTTAEEVVRAIRARLGDIGELKVRVRDLSRPGAFPQGGYPIDLAVRGPKLEEVHQWAAGIAERLRGSGKLTDVWVNPASTPRTHLAIDIDREAAAARGVALSDINTTLELALGSLSLSDVKRFGRTWRLNIKASPEPSNPAKDIGKLKVRNTRGQMIPLGTIVTVRETESPLGLDFLDSRPMVQLTANPVGGLSVQDARKLCEAVAEEVRKELRLPAEYRLTWL